MKRAKPSELLSKYFPGNDSVSHASAGRICPVMKYDSPNCCACKHSSQQRVGGWREMFHFSQMSNSAVFVSTILC